MPSLSSLLCVCSIAAAMAAVNGVGPSVNNSVTIVSGYWSVKSKHSPRDYSKWLQGALGLQCPLVFFHQDQNVMSMVSTVRSRKGLPTTFIHRNVEEAAEKFRYDPSWIHPIHVNNRLLGTIWLDKVFMIADAAELNPYNSEWFVWNGKKCIEFLVCTFMYRWSPCTTSDAGNAFYRVRRVPPRPWPTPELLAQIPKDKIIYTDSDDHPNHSFAG